MIGVLPEIKWPPFICKANTNSAGYRSIVWALCWSHNDAGTLDYPGLRSIFKCMRFFFFLPFCSSSSFIALIRCKHIISAVESPVIFLQHIYFTSCRVCLTLLFKKKERKEDEEEAAPAPEWAPVPQTLSNHHYKMIRSVP